MPMLLLALLVSGCIALYAASEVITPKEMLITVIPAWLQGLGTLGAAYFAWRAFSHWREQELARRRAALAEGALSAAHKAHDTIRTLRRKEWFDANNLEVYAIESLLRDDLLSKLNEVNQAIDAFAEYRVKLRLFLGLRAAEAAMLLLTDWMQIMMAAARLMKLWSEPHNTDGSWRPQAMTDLMSLGVHVHVGPQSPDDSIDDMVAKILDTRLDMFENLLAEHIRYDY